MSLKNKIQKLIARNNKKKKSVAASNKSGKSSNVNAFWVERVPLFTALFFFAFGMGLISDGKKIYNHQLKLSQRVDYKASLNPN